VEKIGISNTLTARFQLGDDFLTMHVSFDKLRRQAQLQPLEDQSSNASEQLSVVRSQLHSITGNMIGKRDSSGFSLVWIKFLSDR
jgi:hypothetical protein